MLIIIAGLNLTESPDVYFFFIYLFIVGGGVCIGAGWGRGEEMDV